MMSSTRPEGRAAPRLVAIEPIPVAFPTKDVREVIALGDGKRFLICHELIPEDVPSGRIAPRSLGTGALDMAFDLIQLAEDGSWELVDRVVPQWITGNIEDLFLLDVDTVLVNELLWGPRLSVVRVTPSGLKVTNSIDIDTVNGCRADECYVDATRLHNGYVCIGGPWSYKALPLMLELRVAWDLQLECLRSGVVDCRSIGDTRPIDDGAVIQEHWATHVFASVGPGHCIGISQDKSRLVLWSIRVLQQALLIEPIQEIQAAGTWSVGIPWDRFKDGHIAVWDSDRGLVLFRWDGRALIEDQLIPGPPGMIAEGLIRGDTHTFLSLAPPRSGRVSPEQGIAEVDLNLSRLQTRWTGSRIISNSPSWIISLAADEDRLIARSLSNDSCEVSIKLPLPPQFWKGIRRFTWCIRFINEHLMLLSRESACFVVDLTKC